MSCNVVAGKLTAFRMRQLQSSSHYTIGTCRDAPFRQNIVSDMSDGHPVIHDSTCSLINIAVS
eukprot:5735363-Amphidinium_carterae.1